jgi:hypothetical protein
LLRLKRSIAMRSRSCVAFASHLTQNLAPRLQNLPHDRYVQCGCVLRTCLAGTVIGMLNDNSVLDELELELRVRVSSESTVSSSLKNERPTGKTGGVNIGCATT